VAGWLKRGPTGVIGTNKSDAAETVRCLLEDLAGGPGEADVPLPRAGLLKFPDADAVGDADPGEWPLAAVLGDRGIKPVSYDEWLRIETAEADLAQALGRGERVKLHNSEAIWSACRPPRG
jgi:ferredoxin/flavodoxin---NADP+ reductase